MAVAMFLLSVSAGGHPYLIGASVLGMGIGFAGVQSPLNNAAANALEQEEIGAGMGLFVGAFFLGGGTGPPVIGAILAARDESGARALNPLHTLDIAAYSDAFLAVVPALLIALAITSLHRSRKPPAV